MKVIVFYSIGIIAGVLAASLIPSSEAVMTTTQNIADLVLRIGQYLFLPIIFFSLPVAVTKLRRIGKLGRLLSLSSVYIIISTALLAVIGTVLALVFDTGRVPVSSAQIPQVDTGKFWDVIRGIVSIEGIKTPNQEGIPLLFFVVFAFLLGWHFHHDKEIAEPAFNLFDSLSRIFYRATRYIFTLMPLFLAVLTFHAVYATQEEGGIALFFPLLRVLLFISVGYIVVLLPLILWLLGKEKFPWRTLSRLSGVFLGAFISASAMFNYGNVTLYLKEKLRIQRQVAALAAPLHLILTRGGTAMVSAICMITIIRSYSSLEITSLQIAWTALFSFLASFILAPVPHHGLTTVLVMLGSLYGRGLENGWNILIPIIPLLTMISVLIDTATGIVILILTNKQMGLETGSNSGSASGNESRFNHPL